MALLGINTGSTANDGTGDPIRVAMGKINSNFREIYNTIGNGTTLSSYVYSAGISTLAENLIGNPIINVSGIFNPGITTTEHIEVRNITSVGIITAIQFVGDGSQLSNVTATFPGIDVLDDNVRRGVARELNFGDRIVTTGPDPVGRVTISADVYSPLSGLSSASIISGYSSTSGYASSSGISSALFTDDTSLSVGVGSVIYKFTDDNRLFSSGTLEIASSDSDVSFLLSRIVLTQQSNSDLLIEKYNGATNIRIVNTLTNDINEWLFRQDGSILFPDGTVQLTGFSGYANSSGISSISENLVRGVNIDVGIVTASNFFGDGSGLTGIVATGSGIEIRDNGNLVGTATTINFNQNLSVSIGSGIATISASDNVSYSEVSGISTISDGLRGSPNITVGVVTSSLIIPDKIYSTVQTITDDSGFIDLRGQNAVTARMILITPISTDHVVVLPEANSGNIGWELILKNKSTDNSLFVRQSNGVDLVLTIDPTESYLLICDGDEWSFV